VIVEAFLNVMATDGDRARFSVDPISFVSADA
jgi:hypothetical protein